MGSEISMEELVTKIINIIGSDISIIKEKTRIRPLKSEVDRLFCDNSKLLKGSKWTPKYSISKGLQATVKWMEDKKNLNLYKSDIYNV